MDLVLYSGFGASKISTEINANYIIFNQSCILSVTSPCERIQVEVTSASAWISEKYFFFNYFIV